MTTTQTSAPFKTLKDNLNDYLDSLSEVIGLESPLIASEYLQVRDGVFELFSESRLHDFDSEFKANTKFNEICQAIQIKTDELYPTHTPSDKLINNKEREEWGLGLIASMDAKAGTSTGNP